MDIMCFRLQRFRVLGSRLRLQILWLSDQPTFGLQGFRAWGLGFRASGLGA